MSTIKEITSKTLATPKAATALMADAEAAGWTVTKTDHAPSGSFSLRFTKAEPGQVRSAYAEWTGQFVVTEDYDRWTVKFEIGHVRSKDVRTVKALRTLMGL